MHNYHCVVPHCLPVGKRRVVSWCHGKNNNNNKSLLSLRRLVDKPITCNNAFIIPRLDQHHHRHIVLRPQPFQLTALVPRPRTTYLKRVARVLGCYCNESCTSFFKNEACQLSFEMLSRIIMIVRHLLTYRVSLKSVPTARRVLIPASKAFAGGKGNFRGHC